MLVGVPQTHAVGEETMPDWRTAASSRGVWGSCDTSHQDPRAKRVFDACETDTSGLAKLIISVLQASGGDGRWWIVKEI